MGISWCIPSAMRAIPIRSRNESASIFNVGCRFTTRLTLPAASIMKPTATTMAMIITAR